MKNLLSYIVFFLGSFLYAQEYVPLLVDYNEWKLTTCYYGCLTDGYYTDGDTLVDGYNYKILDGYHYISRTFLLREDVPEKKVYLNFVEETTDNEYLLYDFSLEVGDSIDMKNPISPFPENAGYYQLDSIVFRPLVDENEYRHFYLSPAISNNISENNAVWIEGAGSLSIINAPGGDPDINGAGHLSCSFKNGNSFYTNLDSIESCEPSILNNNELSFPNINVIVSTNNKLNYCQLSNTEHIRIVDVYDINGKRIDSINNNANKDIRFNTSKYRSGVYFIIVYSKNFKKKTYKIIIN